MLASAELPRNLDVGRSIELVVVNVGAVRQRPSTTRFEVGVPRQRSVELLRTRPEQIELVTQDGIGRLSDLDAALGVVSQELLGDIRPFGARDEERLCREINPQPIDVARAKRREQRAFRHQSRIQVRPRTPGVAPRRVDRTPDEGARRPKRATKTHVTDPWVLNVALPARPTAACPAQST